MNLVIDTELPRSARWAVDELLRTLSALGEHVEEIDAPVADPFIIIGLAGHSPAVDLALAASGRRCPDEPESLVQHPLSPDQLVIAGRDERGLTYALLEAARAVQLAAPGASFFDAVLPAVESPHLAWRSMQLFLCSRKLEEEWFYNEDFWDEYLTRLARCRYNNFSLTFGHQIAYLSPPYPFLVKVPDFPEVSAIGFTPQEHDRHLEMLVRIAAMTRLRSLHFTLGVWSQHAFSYGDPMVEGLTAEILSRYNAAGLAAVLAACPHIDGVQFRMNYESGVAEDQQAEFYEPQFRAIAACGRPIRLDLRAKGLTDATIQLARRMVPDTAISTKHWCEHLGMPYLMPAIQQADQVHYRRYGTWDLLRKPRPYALIHRLWSAGSLRILLWGDPQWVRRFAASCAGGGDGFEIMAPLSNKGVRDERPPWRVSCDPAFVSHAAEQRRHGLFCLLFGRLGYNPDAAPEVWRRELRHRFGNGAGFVEELYSIGSQILPLLTTVFQFSASLWTFWPERFAGRSLDEDAHIEPSDPTQFYRVDEYVADAVENRLCGKWTPPHVAHHLRQLAKQTRGAVATCNLPSRNAELDCACLDFTLLAHLAEYHAGRLLATTHLASYRKTAETAHLPAVQQLLIRARQDWRELAAAADGNYADDLVFGFGDKGHCGHWKDDLPAVDADLDTVEQLIAASPQPPSSPLAPWAGGDIHPDPPDVVFDPPAKADAGRDLALRLCFVSPAMPITAARCYYRIANQALDFTSLDMLADGAGYAIAIPGTAIDLEWDLMLFFEFALADGSITRWPDWRSQTPYFAIATQ